MPSAGSPGPTAALLAAVWLSSAAPLTAAPPETSLRVGAWTYGRDFDTGPLLAAAAHARWRIDATPGLTLLLEGYVEGDTATSVEADVREAVIRLDAGPLTVRAGRQPIAWGRADGLNPTDVASARDYTRLLATDDEQRRGLAMVEARLALGDFTLAGIWLPEFRPSIFPLDRDRPGVRILPDEQREDGRQFALRLERLGSALDWSVGWFGGIDRSRDFVLVEADSPGPILVQQRFPDIDMFGADLAGAAGRFGFRAEAAYTRVRRSRPETGRRDQLWIVAGADTTTSGGWNINAQASLRVITNYRDLWSLPPGPERAVALQSAAVNNQLDVVQTGMTLRMARSFLNERLQLDASLVTFFQRGDLALRPRARYSLNDSTRVLVSADVFAGPTLSYFGRIRSLSALHAQLIRGF